MSRRSGRLSRSDRTNLPAEPNPFVGRERALSTLVQRLHDTRLLSLLGPAGIGKTRLALRLASSLRRQFADGVWWVQLAPVSDAELLPAVIAGVLGIPEAGRGETQAVLEAALSSQHVLLVLDNAEHLVDRVALVVDDLLRSCPKLTVLTTSRKRIGLVYESIHRVAPLGVPEPQRRYLPAELERVESVALFVERARRPNPQFAIEPGNVEDVADLARQLDGLPLAVELAATWMDTLSPGELARELDARYRLLAGRHIVNENHPGLWAAIESSYDRLDQPAQSLLRQLGVFAGGWNLGAMSSVCRLESGAAVEVLGRLVDHSFVEVVQTAEGPTRYRMLEVLRRFALEKLIEAGEVDATARRFAEHIASMAERASPSLTGREGPRWLAMLDADLDNVRAVFATERGWAPEPRRRLATSMVPYWLLRGLVDEGRGHLREVVEELGPASPNAVAPLIGLSWLSWAHGDLGTAARRARGAFLAARRAGDRRGAANALLRLAQAQFDAARVETAGQTTHRAQEIATEVGDALLTAECTLQLGQVALVEGRLDEAESSVSESIRLLTVAGPVHRRVNAQVTLGRVYLHQGRTQAAEETLRGTLTVARELEMVRPSLPMLESLAALAADSGEHGRAARLAGAAAGLLERLEARPPVTAPMRAALVTRWEVALRTPGGDRAFAEGRRMDLSQAIAFALRETASGASQPPRPKTAARPVLTERQLQVARLVADGLSAKDIAIRLRISERTAEGHVEMIMNRLGVNSRAQIAAWVVRHDAAE